MPSNLFGLCALRLQFDWSHWTAIGTMLNRFNCQYESFCSSIETIRFLYRKYIASEVRLGTSKHGASSATIEVVIFS